MSNDRFTQFTLQIQQLERNLAQSEADLALARAESAEARRLIIALGEAFVPEAFAALVGGRAPRAAASLQAMGTPEIVAVIVRALGQKLSQLTAFTRGLATEQQTQVIQRILGSAPTEWLRDPQFAAARREVETGRVALQDARGERDQAQAETERMRQAQASAAAEILRLRQFLAQAQLDAGSNPPALSPAVPTPNSNPGMPRPSAKDALLFILATRGLCERARLADSVVREFGIGGGAQQWMIHAAFEDVTVDPPLVEVLKPKHEIGLGAAPLLYRLNAAGQTYAQSQLKVEPVPSELDRLLKLHDSPEHVALILAVRGLFLDGAYPEPVALVDLYPEPILLHAGKRSEPDLVVVLQNSQRLLIECERDTTKQPAQRADKWHKYFTATQGEFYIITPNAPAAGQLIHEITQWQTQHGGKIHLHVTSVRQVLTDPARFWVYDRTVG